MIRVAELRVMPDGSVSVTGHVPTGSFASIGSFDGVHVGHVRVIEQARQKAAGGPLSVIFFDPHPHLFFKPDSEPFRLSRVEQQLALFDGLGIDHAVIIRFDDNLARMSAEDFARKVLGEALKVAFVGAGFDFNFGARGAGKAGDLVRFGQMFGFGVGILDCQVDAAGNKLSSSAVREALKLGDVATAVAILGRPQAYLGEVVHGAKQGRTIDFPTLNVQLGAYQRPLYGIYVTQTRLGDGRGINGVSNIGVRPTVGGNIELLETYLFDFSEEIYGQEVETLLLAFLRAEAKFESFEAMKVQIAKDAEMARAWFG